MAEFNITGAKLAGKPMVIELDILTPPPPLVLLINPDTLDLKFVPKITEARVRWTDRRDSGYILQAHHDELDMLSASGRSAMFYTNRGITSSERARTVGWENIQHLLAIYRNNGMNFNPKPGRRGTNLIQSVGRVLIVYDEVIYRGSFESFSLTETEEKQFNVDFNFDFKVSRMTNIRGLSNSIMNNVLQSDPRFV